MRQLASSLLIFCASLPATAQSHPPASPADTGSVSGHILCSDTQRPARLAEVRLVPIAIAAPSTGKPNFMEEQAALGSQLSPVQTDMSGAYTLRNVRPGTYYLRVDYTGYLTPLLGFTREQLANPSVAERQQMTSQLQVVTVAPHANSSADATIQRGTSITGTVRYDDGSPAVGVAVNTFRRNAKGQFEMDTHMTHFPEPTDEHGRYILDSLPTDEFVIGATFAIKDSEISTMPSPLGGGGTVQLNMQKVVFSLALYSGDVMRLNTASVIKTNPGQETASIDLTLPLSKLHQVSGSVIAKDGHPVSSGRVALLYADTREGLTNAMISREDGQFHFLYVPEASYILAVEEASDITQIEVANPPGTNPRTHTEDKTIRSYGKVEQPLVVQNDVASLVAIVPDKSTNAAP